MMFSAGFNRNPRLFSDMAAARVSKNAISFNSCITACDKGPGVWEKDRYSGSLVYNLGFRVWGFRVLGFRA